MLTVQYTMSIHRKGAILHRKEPRSWGTVVRASISVCFSLCSKTFTGQMLKSWEVTLVEVRHRVRLGSFLPFIKFKLFWWDRAPIRGKKNWRNHSIVHCGSSKYHGSPDVRGEESSVPIFTETAQFSQAAKLSEKVSLLCCFFYRVYMPCAYTTCIHHIRTSQWSVTLVSFCSVRCVSHRLSKAGPKTSTHFHQRQKQNKTQTLLDAVSMPCFI